VSKIPPRLILAPLALAALLSLGGNCGSALPSESRVLVVYNQNAGTDAAAIAIYYANARSVPSAHVCPVRLPTGQYASADELLGARKTIVEDCICSLLPPGQKPVPCDLSNLPAIRSVSPISHMAFVRGIPPRLTGTGWPSDFEEPSFDFYLSYLVYRDEDIFAPGTSGITTIDYLDGSLLDQASSYMILSAPPLDPALHKDVAYGRIEAIDTGRTLDLIDRTLAAEAAGLSGNFLTESHLPLEKGFDFLADSTGSLDPSCTSYITAAPFIAGAPESTWPHATCRAGTTWVTAQGPDPGSQADDPLSAVVPGNPRSSVPNAIDVGLLLGSWPWPNSQKGFNEFATLRAWRKHDGVCEALCADLPSQPERDQCTAESEDWFGELNTDCVGAALGLIGHQVRSFPVQYYGFLPADWETDGTGAAEKTAPEIRFGEAFLDETHQDDAYLHFGHHAVGAAVSSFCTLEDGTEQPCPERITVNLERTEAVSPALPVGTPRPFALLLRHRNTSSPGGALRARLTFSNSTASVTKEIAIPLDQENLDWVTAAEWVWIDPAELAQIDTIRVALRAGFADGLFGALDLDGIEIWDIPSVTQVLDPIAGTFDEDHHQVTHPGDWAATAIDRLGAVAWWGSSSHHLLGGWAFSNEERFYGAFFQGRTLGESLVLTTGGVAGIVYGDPLFRPVGVRLHLPGLNGYGKPPGLSVDGGNSATVGTILANAFLGTDHIDDLQWAIETCPSHDLPTCEALWTPEAQGTGAVEDTPIPWAQWVDLEAPGTWTLRLRVWNPGEEARELRHHAYFTVAP
jgi:hypothetical protein